MIEVPARCTRGVIEVLIIVRSGQKGNTRSLIGVSASRNYWTRQLLFLFVLNYVHRSLSLCFIDQYFYNLHGLISNEGQLISIILKLKS